MTITEVPTNGLSELTSRKQWVCWMWGERKADGTFRKTPCQPSEHLYPINAQDRAYHMTHNDALWAYGFFVGIEGIGFVPLAEDPFCFLDIDRCVDPNTGEYTKPWVPDLIDKLESLTYLTPSKRGIRIVVKAKLLGKGGDYVWEDSGEKHTFEVYDSKQFLTVTETILLDRPIKGAQSFVDGLKPQRKQHEVREARPFLEVDLRGGLKETRKEVKRVLIEHGLHPDPIHEHYRKKTLISVGGALLMRGMSEERLWTFLNEINVTLLYNVGGELEGLDWEELQEIHEVILKLEPKISSLEVQQNLDVLHDYLASVRPYLKGAFHSDWKLLMGLVPHGRKYGKMIEDKIKIDCSWGTLMGLARIRSRDTFRTKISRLEGVEVMRTGKSVGDASGHFILDIDRLISCNYFNAPDDLAGEYEQPYQSNGCVSKQHNNHYLGTVSNTYWHRGFGNAKGSVIAAVMDLGGRARISDIAIRMGRIDENGKAKSGSISGTVKELCGKEYKVLRRVSRGLYEFTEDFAQDVYEARVRNEEFVMDEKYQSDLEDHRRKYEETKEQIRRENRSWLQRYMDYKEGGGSKGIIGWLKENRVRVVASFS